MVAEVFQAAHSCAACNLQTNTSKITHIYRLSSSIRNAARKVRTYASAADGDCEAKGSVSSSRALRLTYKAQVSHDVKVKVECSRETRALRTTSRTMQSSSWRPTPSREKSTRCLPAPLDCPAATLCDTALNYLLLQAGESQESGSTGGRIAGSKG